MNKSTASGKLDQIKGKMKQGLGEATDNDRMANSGAMDQVKGHAKEAWGNSKDAARTTSQDKAADIRADKHDIRNKVTSVARDAKDSVSEKADDFKRRRSA
ncbi:MAG TPA: CsbD family protein [Acidobacteriaceae bacterium]|jgi:uncharacterized protein YjbJ (UPF0337 family)|nr:CsbD family protein [Acidobacteriaceae bacterium]